MRRSCVRWWWEAKQTRSKCLTTSAGKEKKMEKHGRGFVGSSKPKLELPGKLDPSRSWSLWINWPGLMLRRTLSMEIALQSPSFAQPTEPSGYDLTGEPLELGWPVAVLAGRVT